MRFLSLLLAACLLAPVGARAARPAQSDDWFTVPARTPPVVRTLPVDRNALLNSFAPFYRIGPGGLGLSDAVVIEQEVSRRLVFSVTAPFEQAEIPLPLGNWTVVGLGSERSVDDGPGAMGSVLARLENHTVTGLVLIRGADKHKPGSLAALPPDRSCEERDRYAAGQLASSGDGRQFCWFISEETDPALIWTLPEMPPALRYAVGTLRATGDVLPHAVVGATIFRMEGNRWIEVTTFMDPARSGVPDAHGMRRPAATARNDPAMRTFIDRMANWTKQRATLVAHLSARRRSADEVGAINLEAPQ